MNSPPANELLTRPPRRPSWTAYLAQKTDEAEEAETAAKRARDSAKDQHDIIEFRQQLLANATSAVDARISRLVSLQLLTEQVDLEDRRFVLDADSALAEAPRVVTAVLTALDSRATPDTPDQQRQLAQQSIDELTATVDHACKRSRDANDRAETRLSRFAQCLQLATDDRSAASIQTALSLRLPPAVITRLEQRQRVPQERIDRTTMADTRWWQLAPLG